MCTTPRDVEVEVSPLPGPLLKDYDVPLRTKNVNNLEQGEKGGRKEPGHVLFVLNTSVRR
jgi:hypothetical protein